MSEVNLPGFGKVRIITVEGEDVVLDPRNLRFTDATLNQFFELVSGFCDYYGQKLAEANRSVARCEQLFERFYIEKFRHFRENEGKSEKTSELYSKAEDEVVRAKSAVHEMTFKRDSILNHLKALNAAREDAHNRGHFLRKELEKLNMDVRAFSNDVNEVLPNQPPTAVARIKSNSWQKSDPEMESLFQLTQKKETHE